MRAGPLRWSHALSHARVAEVARGWSAVARPFAVRGAVVWVALRLIVVAVTRAQAADVSAVPGPLPPLVRLGVVALATMLGYADVWRRREGVLLGNLGFGLALTAATLALPALVGEVALALLAAMR